MQNVQIAQIRVFSYATLLATRNARAMVREAIEQQASDVHTPALVRDTKKGEYVRFKVGGPVWIREEYSRELKAYMFAACDDVNRTRAAKSTKTVFIGFTY